jgi:hypothetical protein
MIISRGRNYIFIHIPKTGGTSMALALEARAKADDLMLGDTPKAVRRRHKLKDAEAKGRLWKHSTLRDLEGVISAGEMQSMFVFTMVRNPWDRMASYYHWLQSQSFDHVAVLKAKELEFSDFLRDPQIIRSIRSWPYRNYTLGPNGEDYCNLFVRLEHLAEDLSKLEDALEIKLGSLPLENKSSRPETTNLYSDEDRQQVALMCAADIKQFGYSFPT